MKLRTEGQPNPIVKVGRVQDWLDNPVGKLPVSCTTFKVMDSMTQGEDSIEASWRFVSWGLRNGAGVGITLDEIRPEGHINDKGLYASGPVSFAKIYSALNETLRRGGVQKIGAVTLHLSIDHPDILTFVRATRSELPWVKRCVDLTEAKWIATAASTKEEIIRGIARGDIWLNKIKYNKHGERLLSNVCLEVYTLSRGTCLLSHVNMGACHVGMLKTVFVDAMTELCQLHGKTGVGGEYLTPAVDKQVGLGILGLANFLAYNKVTYKEFGDALELVNKGKYALGTAGVLAHEFQEAIDAASDVAYLYGMERAYCIAPTASCSYRSKDLLGYTATPEIAPPIDRVVSRDSGELGVVDVNYGPDIEIAREAGWDVYKKVADEIMIMYERTGLLHGYSFNSWSDMVTYDEAFIEEWLQSPQTSLYYSLQVGGDTQDKTSAYAALDEEEVENYLTDLFTKEPDPNATPDPNYKIECYGCEQ